MPNKIKAVIVFSKENGVSFEAWVSHEGTCSSTLEVESVARAYQYEIGKAREEGKREVIGNMIRAIEKFAGTN